MSTMTTYGMRKNKRTKRDRKAGKVRYDKCKTIDKRDQVEDSTAGLTEGVFDSKMSL